MSDKTAKGVAFSLIGESARKSESVITRLMADKLARPEMLSLAAGFTDNRVLPEPLVREAVAALDGGGRAHLQYGMNRGRPGLRKRVAELLRSYPSEAELDLDEGDVLITNGSQQALYILVQMLCDPGDIVLVERPSYFVFLELLAGLGVRAVSLPADADGRLHDPGMADFFTTLAETGDLERVKLVYLMGTFANPSTRCLDELEKSDLARRLQALPRPVPVIEDMAYRELYFDQPYPARSLLSLPQWRDYPVFYLGTFTKPFATGLKVGFLASREQPELAVFARIKGHHDFGTGHFDQAILEWVLASGQYPQHLAAIRRHYREKRDLLEVALIENGLREAGWHWEQPKGGLLLWARGPEGADTRMDSAFHQACMEKEVMYVPGDLCYAEGYPWSRVRLSFGALEAELIPEAARRFCAAALATASGKPH
jgi:2-aminoadipate transaminase